MKSRVVNTSESPVCPFHLPNCDLAEITMLLSLEFIILEWLQVPIATYFYNNSITEINSISTVDTLLEFLYLSTRNTLIQFKPSSKQPSFITPNLPSAEIYSKNHTLVMIIRR